MSVIEQKVDELLAVAQDAHRRATESRGDFEEMSGKYINALRSRAAWATCAIVTWIALGIAILFRYA